MGYQFAGFFARSDTPILDAALRRWPGCRGRLITEPFPGIGVAVNDHVLTYGGSTEEEYEQAQELAWAIEQELVEWSRQYPATRFVFLRAECFGGECLYEGYVCQDGSIHDSAQDTDEDNGDALPRLVRALGVKLGTPPYFEPLTRHFFDRSH
ncbi:MAG: hypothetical protein ACXVDA_13670 [Ktedonobacterales bacterium]